MGSTIQIRVVSHVSLDMRQSHIYFPYIGDDSLKMT